MKFSAPWGVLDSENGPIGMLQFFRAQLQYFLDENMSPNREFTIRELTGYDMVLATGSKETASAFICLKGDLRDHDGKAPENLAVVAMLKERGEWVDCRN